MGVIRVSPIFNVNGAVVVSGEDGAVADSFCGGGTTAFGEGAAGSGGTIGARLATSPGTDLGPADEAGADAAGVAAGGAAAVADTLSICFFWPSRIIRNSSICFC